MRRQAGAGARTSRRCWTQRARSLLSAPLCSCTRARDTCVRAWHQLLLRHASDLALDAQKAGQRPQRVHEDGVDEGLPCSFRLQRPLPVPIDGHGEVPLRIHSYCSWQARAVHLDRLHSLHGHTSTGRLPPRDLCDASKHA